jgi:hypothetical protein
MISCLTLCGRIGMTSVGDVATKHGGFIGLPYFLSRRRVG